MINIKNVSRIEGCTFKVVCKELKIDAEVSYSSYNPKVKGKGSRNHKDAIIEAVEQFMKWDREQRNKKAVAEAKEAESKIKFEALEDRSLYMITVLKSEDCGQSYEKKEEYYTGDVLKEKEYFGYIMDIKKINISNASIVIVGSARDYHRIIRADKRYFDTVLNGVACTGLTLKERIAEGLSIKGYNIKKILAPSNQEFILKNINKFATGAIISLTPTEADKTHEEINMLERAIEEFARAEEAPQGQKPYLEEVEKIEVVEEVQEVEEKEETEIKPFSIHTLGTTNNIISTLMALDWTLNSIEIKDNCIYGNITNKYDKESKEGLFAGSDFDKNVTEEVFRCLKSKMVNVEVVGGKEVKELSTLSEEMETSEEAEETNNLKVVLNEEKKGIELYFQEKPSSEIRNKLKSNGFWWYKKKACWLAKQTKERFNLVEEIKQAV